VQATTQEIADMTSAFSKLTMHTDQHPGRGIEIRSPVSGLVNSPDELAGPVYQSGLMPDAVQVQLQGHQLVAPFSGIVTSTDRGGHRILLHHSNGLKLEIAFPPQTAQHTLGFRWLVATRSKVSAGQPLLQFDAARLTPWCQPLYCILALSDHPKIQRIHSKSGYVAAGLDPLFWLELSPAVAN
jgi:PTS system glucose-specific IIA component